MEESKRVDSRNVGGLEIVPNSFHTLGKYTVNFDCSVLYLFLLFIVINVPSV